MLRKVFRSQNYQDADLVDVVFAKIAALDEKKLCELPERACVDHTVLGTAYAASLVQRRKS